MSTAPLLASLPMYDWPEVQPAYDALWAGIRDRLRAQGVAAPTALQRGGDFHAPWYDDALLFSQTCGYPYATALRTRVQLVATPCYAVPGCEGPTYASAVVVHRRSPLQSLGDLARHRCGTCAVNSLNSQSGYWAVRAAFVLAEALPPEQVLLSGGHRASLLAVATGAAEVAGIDAVCWAMAQRHESAAAAELKVLGFTPSAPGLPFITGPLTTIATLTQLRLAVQSEIAAGGAHQAELFLTGCEVLPSAAYDRIGTLAELAAGTPWPAPTA